MLRGNKGEWSEIYVLLKIISDNHLKAGDGKLEVVEGLIYPIVSIIRGQVSDDQSFTQKSDIVIIHRENSEVRIPVTEFREQCTRLLKNILKSKSGAFELPGLEEFLKSFGTTSLKAKSSSKSDIRVKLYDFRTGLTPDLGFSIKSRLGGASTLLNPGKTTNIVYKIEGAEFNSEKIQSINSIQSSSKVKDRVARVYAEGGWLSFEKFENGIFWNNLTLIDTALPTIISSVVLRFFTSLSSSVEDLISDVEKKNPLDFELSFGHDFYAYKLKKLLTDIALGMVPSKVWNGKLDATGGYLVVREDGEVLCYHIYNRNDFEDYLLQNTKLETASTSRFSFGELYQKDQQTFMNLNLQIRFKK